ncbi:MAG: transposase [Prevotella sp.]|nr:transposase [Prevotella sp.]
MARPRFIGNYNRYTDEQRRQVIKEYIETDLNYYEVGRKLGVNPKTVFFWCKMAKAKKRQPPRPFNVLVTLLKDGKCHDLKEFAEVEEARVYAAVQRDKGYEVEIREL